MRITEGMNLRRTAQDPGAAQIHVALFLEIWDLEVAKNGHTIVVGVIVVPLVSLGMDEKNRVGKIVVIINYISAAVSWCAQNRPRHGDSRQIHHRFPPLIQSHRQRRFLVVRHVDAFMPLRKVCVQP